MLLIVRVLLLAVLMVGLEGAQGFSCLLVCMSSLVFDGDATSLVQRPLSVLPIVYRTWASARMGAA